MNSLNSTIQTGRKCVNLKTHLKNYLEYNTETEL